MFQMRKCRKFTGGLLPNVMHYSAYGGISNEFDV